MDYYFRITSAYDSKTHREYQRSHYDAMAKAAQYTAAAKVPTTVTMWADVENAPETVFTNFPAEQK